ncbi:MAG: ribonuclease HII [Candidatus Dadabacteria bacterium]|nr:ribonuclease HII [Candidatus Dadabacteria bacterium]MCZ6685871.1 ribonuclease HII [Candidatus Dadabacteria bacterium]
MSPPNLEFEKEIWAKGRIPAGVDEAGRGPLAGPVVAAAVVLPDDCKIEGLDDSKKLSHSKRKKILEEIKLIAISYAVGIVEPDEIDRINILRAALLAMEISVKQLTTKPDYLLIDGNQKTSLLLMQETIVKGDSKSCSIAAASILAKVTRDTIMEEYHSIYPEYNFKGHKGYPTKEHYQALREYGPCPIHRKTFRGVL